MNCSKCGTLNSSDAKFCIKCGNALQSSNIFSNNNVIDNQMATSQGVEPPTNQPVSQNTVIQQGVQVNAQPVVPNTSSFNYPKYILNALLHPMQNFKKEEEKLNSTKVSFILLLIMVAVMLVSNVVQTVLSTVRVTEYSWTDGYVTTWKWEKLGEINWLETIGKNFLIYAGIILIIVVLFYIVSLIFKKNLNFIKILSISASAVIPAVLGVMVLSPILGAIWEPLSIIFSILGLVYSVIVLYELINSNLDLDSDMKIYFNLLCFGILLVAGYFAYINLFVTVDAGDLESIFDLFG